MNSFGFNKFGKRAALITAVPCFLLILVLFVIGTSKTAEAAQVPSTISIESGVISSGETITVSIDLNIPTPNSLSAATLRFEFDPTVIRFDSCATNNTDFQLNLCNLSESDGVSPDVVSFSAISVFGIAGDINLGTITFTGTDVGTSPMTIVADTFEDGSGEAPLIMDGTIEVQSPTAITLSSISVKSSTTPSGIPALPLLLIAAGVNITIYFLIWRKGRGERR
ncbi:MAG: cohesin domain-containing protein [Candidatus Promineifilaceae bacterium]